VYQQSIKCLTQEGMRRHGFGPEKHGNNLFFCMVPHKVPAWPTQETPYKIEWWRSDLQIRRLMTLIIVDRDH
jgi:hypothetical protein